MCLMRIATLQNPVSMDELHQMAGERFGDMVKAVVDLRQGISNTQKQIEALVQQLVQR